MREDKGRLDPQSEGPASSGDISFVVFSLAHAGWGEVGVTELRLGERWLLGWCPLCAALEIFGSPD